MRTHKGIKDWSIAGGRRACYLRRDRVFVKVRVSLFNIAQMLGAPTKSLEKGLTVVGVAYSFSALFHYWKQPFGVQYVR